MKVLFSLLLHLVLFYISCSSQEVVCSDGWCEETSVMSLISNQLQVLKVNKYGIEKLNSWTSSKVYTLSFIGPGRKGKSTLATRFIPCDPKIPGGFQVGSTMEPVTEGIDMWSQEIPFKDGSLLLLDTEGTDNPFGNLNHQKRLSLVVSLLSSMVIYNVMDTLTNHDLDKLAQLIDFRQMIKYESQTDSWPALIILIQNSRLQFTLKGKPLTNDQFLEYLLEPKGDEHDRSRKLIKSFFSFRTLHVLPTPSPQDLHLIRCPTDPNTPYSEAFKSFKQAVEFIITPKAFGERVASPKDLAKYIPAIVEGANAEEIDMPSISSRINEKRLQTVVAAVIKEFPFPASPKECDPKYKEQINQVLGFREKKFTKELESQKLTGAFSSSPDETLRLRKFYGGMITNHSKPEYEPLIFSSERLCVTRFRQNIEVSLSNHPLLSPTALPKDRLAITHNLKGLAEKTLEEFNSKIVGVMLPLEELELHRALLTTYIQQIYARIVKGLRDHIESLAFLHPELCPINIYKDRIAKERQQILLDFLNEISGIFSQPEVDLQKQLVSSSLDLLEKKRTDEQRETCRPNRKALLYMKGPHIHCKLYYFEDAIANLGDLTRQDWVRFEEEKSTRIWREQTRQMARGTNLGALDKWFKERENSKEALLKDCESLDSY